MGKKKVWVLCGGESAERNVSMVSARTIFKALDPCKYEKELVWISPQGQWFKKSVVFIEQFEKVRISNGWDFSHKKFSSRSLSDCFHVKTLPDIVFPALHGPLGEDGAVQGFLEMLHIPYVGCGVLGSALGMDKEFSKILAERAGIPVLPYFCIYDPKEAGSVAQKLGFPVFVKPARLGSSVGISKVLSIKELFPAVKNAFKYDSKVLIEKAIMPREIECAVLGDPRAEDSRFKLRASALGEVVPYSDFYDYKTKYLTQNGAGREIPAKLSKGQEKQVQDYSMRVFKALDGYGLGRVDFLMDKKTRKIYFNEINTLPGFTSTSMYPALWGFSGLKIQSLMDILIELAFRRDDAAKRLKAEP
jgi:D-alanine-D-alanine ligase